jgi:hypothetical protein
LNSEFHALPANAIYLPQNLMRRRFVAGCARC